LLPVVGEEVQGLADRGPAVGLEDAGAGVGDVVTEDRGDDRLAGVAVAEVDDAVVVTDYLEVAVAVRVVQGEQLPDGARPQRVTVPAPQRRPAPGEQGQDEGGEVADQQQGEQGAGRGQAGADRAQRPVLCQDAAPGSVRAGQGVNPGAPGRRPV